MKLRRRIHSNIKIASYFNILPKEYENTIHRSQILRYRDIHPQEYFGNELSSLVTKEIDFIRQLGDFPKLKSTAKAILKLFVFFRSTVSKTKGFYKIVRKQKDFFVELSQRFRNEISVHQFAKLIGLDENTLRNWITEVRVRCSDSLINSCRKVHPNQLLSSEVDKMKKLLLDITYQYWPLISVYYLAMRNNICSMALSTWYKYARLLNIKRIKPRSIKNYSISIQANFPNQYWHADVTKVKTMDKTWNYIYTVIDNYSKFPLSVFVSDKLCGKIRMQTFREALRKTIELSPSIETINLVVDGGSENFNGTVNDFLKNLTGIKIHRIRALRDVIYSNSIAEAFNRILKTYYLNHKLISDLNELILRVEESVNDFSFNRPHGKLNGLTPFEAFIGNVPDKSDFKNQIADSRVMRVQLNRNYSCMKCNFK